VTIPEHLVVPHVLKLTGPTCSKECNNQPATFLKAASTAQITSFVRHPDESTADTLQVSRTCTAIGSAKKTVIHTPVNGMIFPILEEFLILKVKPGNVSTQVMPSLVQPLRSFSVVRMKEFVSRKALFKSFFHLTKVKDQCISTQKAVFLAGDKSSRNVVAEGEQNILQEIILHINVPHFLEFRTATTFSPLIKEPNGCLIANLSRIGVAVAVCWYFHGG
jgi:hypothetical protein